MMNAMMIVMVIKLPHPCTAIVGQLPHIVNVHIISIFQTAEVFDANNKFSLLCVSKCFVNLSAKLRL